MRRVDDTAASRDFVAISVPRTGRRLMITRRGALVESMKFAGLFAAAAFAGGVVALALA